MRISVIGCGYLGATHAAAMAEIGHEVRGVDVDPVRVAALEKGEAPFHEPGLDDLLSRHVASGRLTFGCDFGAVADWADLHFICVNTPQVSGELRADLSQLDSAVDMLAPLLRAPTVVVGKSTVPVGTAAAVATRLRSCAPAADRVSLVWNPEFLREGHAVRDTTPPD